MKRSLSRREFLKLASLVPLGLLAPRLEPAAPGEGQAPVEKKQNVLIILFDTLSAHDVSLYGYPRDTTPHLRRWADRAVVYHNHFASANWTLPGTASLLTGTHPWTHRATSIGAKKVTDALARNNIFHAFHDSYRLAYSHNPLAAALLNQFSGDMDEVIPRIKLFLTSDNTVNTFFRNDEDTATVGWIREMKRKDDGYAYSLFLSHLYEWYQDKKVENIRQSFPRGLPSVNGDNYYILEPAIDETLSRLTKIHQPFCGYFHYHPPHSPYNTHIDFYGRFAKDQWKPVAKPVDLFTEGKSAEYILKRRQAYDEFILYVDREFSRLLDSLEASGILDTTWVVLTADHGEMFERGIHGHDSEVLYQPVIHIPLVIFEPGRRSRLDVYDSTSAVDVLPTLLHGTGREKAGWGEGTLLPPYGPAAESIFALRTSMDQPAGAFTVSTAMLVKHPYKLIYYFGYEKLNGSERIQLFDIQADPDELDDLYPKKTELGKQMLAELKAKLAEANAPYL